MARKASVDFEKPWYIDSFRADELIFDLIRGNVTKGGLYEGSLTESLDVRKMFQIKDEAEGSPAEKRRIFRKTGTGERYRKFCNAVINIEMAEDIDFARVRKIQEDLDSFGRDTAELKKVLEREMADESLSEQYLSFLDIFQKNRTAYRSLKKKKSEKIQTDGDLKLGNGYVLTKTTVSVNNTEVRITAAVRQTGKEGIQEGNLKIGVSKPDERGKSDGYIGVYEHDGFIMEKGTRNTEISFDLKEVMKVTEGEDGKDVYLLEKGDHAIWALGEGQARLLAILCVPEDVVQKTVNRSQGWITGEWEEVPGIAAGAGRLEPDLTLSKTYRQCRQKYAELLDTGLRILFERKEIEIRGKRSRYLMRQYLYEAGTDIDTGGQKKHFVMYKRSASKSKQGSVLFIRDDFYKKMMEWSWFGYRFESDRKYDLTSIKAYEALTLSSIKSMFGLKRENILIIDAVEGRKVNGNRWIACNYGESGQITIRSLSDCEKCPRLRRGRKKCNEEVLKYRNTLWDGQALLDESVFERVFTDKDGKQEQHGMMLLRNRFFKACAFNTRITEYYKKHGIKTVHDMFGNELKAKDIRLIFTPDSLKLLKFGEDFGKEQSELYEKWLGELEDFGVVKWDKVSGNDGRYKVGYQILNTLPLSKEEVEELFVPEREYIEKLWTDEEFFLERIPKDSEKGRCIYELYRHFGKDFALTPDFRQYRSQMVNDRKRRLKEGEIQMKGDMYVLCSMPFEMLRYSGQSLNERKGCDIAPGLGPDEGYIPGLADGEQITLCRYPHLSSGSVCVLKNRIVPEYEEWFNLRNETGESGIAVVSPWESNVMIKLGGADFDSDSALFIKEEPVRKAAACFLDESDPRYARMGKYRPGTDGLPVAQAAPVLLSAGKKEIMIPGNLAWLDHSLARTQVSIGRISNDIQLFNCYLLEALDDEECDTEQIEALYECILKLSVLNELEIDKAKHSVKVQTDEELDMVEHASGTGNSGEILKKKTVSRRITTDNGVKKVRKVTYCPSFLYDIKKDRGSTDMKLRGKGNENRFWNCPADHLARLAYGLRKPRDIHAGKEKILVYEKRGSSTAVSRQVKETEEILMAAVKEIRKLQANRTDDDIYEKMIAARERCFAAVAGRKLNEQIISCILRDAMCRKKTRGSDGNHEYWNEEMHRSRYVILGFLFAITERLGKEGRAILKKAMAGMMLIDAENDG